MACVMRIGKRWVVDYYDQQKKRHRLSMPKGSSKRKANQKLGEIEKKISQGVWIIPKDLPRFSEVADAWLTSKQSSIRHSTLEQYEGHLKHHLKPFFEGVKINSVTFDSVERLKQHILKKHIEHREATLKEYETSPWFDDLKTLVGEPRENDLSDAVGAKIDKIPEEEQKRFWNALEQVRKASHPTSVATLRKILITLGAVLTYAVRMRYVDFNPVREIEKPRGTGLREEEEGMVILKPEAIQALLNHTATQKDRVFFMTAVLTGMRQGELLGLQWGDIDWLTSQIHVKRTFNHGAFMEPKTERSRRKIDLAPELIHELKIWKLACPKGELELVFPTENGTTWDASNMVRRNFLPALRRAGLPKIRFHDLRHTYASLLVDQGENPKYIQSQMGHYSINVTMDIYGHLFRDVNQEAASKLGKKVLGTINVSTEPNVAIMGR
jgi:integrase